MKKIIIFTCIIVIALSLKSQEEFRTFNYIKNGSVVTIDISNIDSVTFSNFSVPNNSTGVLINGVIWATCNVNKPGEFASHPFTAGMFYQWNRKVGWSSTDPLVNHEGGGTWDDSDPEGDTWEKENDPCPTGWRVPTFAEQESLLNSGSFWGELNGVNGRFFGNGTQRVFLPAAGCRSGFFPNGMLQGVNYFGKYWSSTSYDTNYSTGAELLNFFSDYTGMGSQFRKGAYSVRCVAE